MHRSLTACSLALLLAMSACSSAGRAAMGGSASASASAVLRSADGTPMGVLALTPAPGGVLLSGQLTGVPAGAHGIHFHTVGRCDGPEFTTAGAHFNPGSTKHGLLNPEGPHAGDLPAVAADASGRAAVNATTVLVTLSSAAGNGLLDADGSAIVVHAASDDQRTDPSGNSGGRIACGVIERQSS